MTEERRPTISEEALIVCRCEEIARAEIEAAIAAGCDSVTWVKRKTRAGMGLCQGRTCGRLVAAQLAEAGACDHEQTLPRRARSPVRPLPLGMLAAADDPPEMP